MKFIPELYKNVQKLVPEGAFYKFHDIWRLSTVKVSLNRFGIIGRTSRRGPCITVFLVLYDNVVCNISGKGIAHH